MTGIQLAERRLFPDCVIRYGIRRLLRTRLIQESYSQKKEKKRRFEDLLTLLTKGANCRCNG